MTRQGGSETLRYQLYTDALGLDPWTGVRSQLYLLNQMGSGQTVYVYGRAAAGQAVRVGSYSDTPAVVITY